MKSYLFEKVIDGWKSWGKVFCDIKAFAPVIRSICERHGLTCGEILGLSPGTNAVFRVGGFVVKIYAPKESGLTPNDNELKGLKHAAQAGVNAPEVIAEGAVNDRYLFPYIVMNVIRGREAGDILPSLCEDERIALARRLKDITKRLNVKVDLTLDDDVRDIALDNRRWDVFPQSLRSEVARHARSLNPNDFVFTHGDLTAENVLLDGGDIKIIDFGDCHLAPYYYEWVPLAFDLMRCDRAMLSEYFGKLDSEFFDTMTDAVLLHDFGGDFAQSICRQLGVHPLAITGKGELKNLIVRRIEGA